MAGREARQTFDDWQQYDSIYDYAIVYWGNNEATVLVVEDSICGGECSGNDLPMEPVIGIDRDDNEWLIEVGSLAYC